jgi:DNA mismatch repair protein MutS
MTIPDLPGPGSPISVDGGRTAARPSPEAAATRFESILFAQPGGGSGTVGPEEPGYFADLNLDQVLKSMTGGREQYELKPLFYAPLHEVDAVRYRHEVLRDLEKREVLEPVSRFAEAMRRMRQHLEQVRKLHYQLQKQAWFLDAAEIYCTAVRAGRGACRA